MDIHKLNGFIYVTSEDEIKVGEYCVNTETNNIDILKNGMEGYNVKYFGWRKIILTNDPKLTNVQQLTHEEEAYCKTVDSVKVEKEKYSERFDTDKSPIGNYETWGNRYKLQLPKQETIEEVANKANGYILYANGTKAHLFNEGFIEGYNHAVKTLYTEEEVLVLLQKRDAYNFEANAKSLQKWETPKEWFNQNKKK